jgi:penicillin amidase
LRLTIFNIDQGDLQVHELNPDHPYQYHYQGKWEPIRAVGDQIAVRGAHLPGHLCRGGKELRIRGAFRLPRARHDAVFRRRQLYEGDQLPRRQESHDELGRTDRDHVYAHVQGNIGWVPGSFAFKCPNREGLLLPAPGNGPYQWAGFWSGDNLASVCNPANAWFSSSAAVQPGRRLRRNDEAARPGSKTRQWATLRHHLMATPLAAPGDDAMQERINVGPCPSRVAPIR